MPTRYWLVGPTLRAADRPARGRRRRAAGRGRGRPRRARRRPRPLRGRARRRHARRPRPARARRAASAAPGQGVKCLHAHYAWFLAGGDDPVGRVGRRAARRPRRPAGRRRDRDAGRSTAAPTRPACWSADGDRTARTARAADAHHPAGPGRRRHRPARPRRDRAHRSPSCASTAAVMDRYGVEPASGSRPRRRPATPPTATSSSTAAEAVVGVRPELLSGDEEGRLSFAGATADLDPADGPVPRRRHRRRLDRVRRTAAGRRATARVSIDIGCVRLTEQFLEHDPPRPEELSRRLSVADDLRRRRAQRDLPESSTAHDVRRPGRHGVDRGRGRDRPAPTYDRDRIHHFVLTQAAVEDVFRTLATETRADRHPQPRARGGAGRRDRRRLLRAGRASCAASASTSAWCREADILDGLVRSSPASPLSAWPYDARRAALRSGAHGPGAVQPLPRGDRGVRPADARPPRPRVPRPPRRDLRAAAHGVPHRQPAHPSRSAAPARPAWRRRSSTSSARATSSWSASTACSASACATSPARCGAEVVRVDAAVGPAARPAARCSTPTRRPKVIAVVHAETSHRRAQRRRRRSAPARATPCCWSTASPRSAASRSRSTAGASTSPTAAPRSASACRPGLAPFTVGDRGPSSGCVAQPPVAGTSTSA